MKLAIGILLFAAALLIVEMWTAGAIESWMVVAAGLGIFLFAGIFGLWWRDRQRRRSVDMRDSALW